MFGDNHFGVIDYLALAGTILFSIFIGFYYAYFGKQTKDEMLVGGRNMKIIPVAISMLVTYFSAVSILGTPAEVYAYGTQVYFVMFLMFIFVPLSTMIYVKVFYEMKLTSIYEYLEIRFKSRIVRQMISFIFILQLTLINGITLFAPGIALKSILGIPEWLSIVSIGVIGTVYTSVGGIKAVIWTDVFQFCMIMVGMGAIVIKGFIKAGGIVSAFEKASERGRLQLFDFTIDPFQRHNTLNFIIGSGFTMLSLYGTHQPLVQRYCSLPSTSAAIKTLLFTMPLGLFTYSITMVTGVSAVATYSGCCPLLLGEIDRLDAIIPHFVIQELAVIPGLMGIFISCIFSAVLSSVSSYLNSLAAVTWEDFLSKIEFFKSMKPETQGHCTKILSAIYGVISIGVAFGAGNLGTLFQIFMTAIGATSGPLGGIFLCGLFLPFMNKQGATGGIIAGLATMIFLAVQAFNLAMSHVLFPRLPSYLTECPNGTDFSNAKNFTDMPIPEFDYPTKLYTLSYTLYPFVGAVITVGVGVLISACTGGFTTYRVEKKYIHPWIWDWKCVQRFVIKEDNVAVKANKGSFKDDKKEDSQYPYKYELVDKNEMINNNVDVKDNAKDEL